MKHLQNYSRQLFDLSFRRKTNFTLLLENINKNPEGIFISVFKTTNHKIVYEENFGLKRDVVYSAYHLFFGNDINHMAYILASDLSYKYQSVIHKEQFCGFMDLPQNIQDKMIVNLDNLAHNDSLFNCIELYAKKKISTFIFPDNKSYFDTLNKSLICQKLNSTLDKKDKEKVKKI